MTRFVKTNPGLFGTFSAMAKNNRF